MKFEETSKDFFEIPKELMGDCYVYFLLEDDEVVYVGQATNGMYRPFSHKDKKFNRVIAVPCEECNLDEAEFANILKYKPKYNKSIGNASRFSLKALKKDLRENYGAVLSITQIVKMCGEKGLEIHSYKGVDSLAPDDYNELFYGIRDLCFDGVFPKGLLLPGFYEENISLGKAVRHSWENNQEVNG